MGLPARTAALAASAVVACFGTATAQASRRLSPPRPIFEVAVALPSLLVDDRNGARVWSTFAPVVGVAGAWQLSPNLHSEIGLRGSLAGVTVDAGAEEWNAGRTSQIAIRFGLERRFQSRIGLSVAASGTWLAGPEDVTPFRDNAGWHWGGDAGVSWRIGRTRPLSLFAAVDGFMLGPASPSDPVAISGWVRRIVIGVRRGN